MEKISALMDGELEGQEATSALGEVFGQAAGRADWERYHLISDALRSEYLLSKSFSEKVSRRLEAEPTVLAPRRQSLLPQRVQKTALSLAASVSAIAVVAWLAFSNNPIEPGGGAGQLALKDEKPPIAAVTAGPARPQLAAMEGSVGAYLLAHQEYSPTTQIQGVASYVRTLAESPADGVR
jgi:sigma-E factor negative regulatory protein RseA